MTYLTEPEIRQAAKRFADASGGQNALAREMDVSAQYVSMMLLGKKPPSTALLDLMGYEKITLYQPKGMNDETV